MPRAYVTIREAPWYRREAFAQGLRAAGYETLLRPPGEPQRGDVLVVWNRYSQWNDMATRFEKGGGTVLVAENGYIGMRGVAPKFSVHPHGPTPDDYYALAKHGHNGSGEWVVGDDSRWQALGLGPEPWQSNPGGHILVCGQRGIGSPTMASPPDWHSKAAAQISKRTKRRVQVRLHPGNNAPAIPLDVDLKGAFAVVVWSSGSGVKALVKGIPVFYDAPYWICSAGARRLEGGATIEDPLRDDAARMTALIRMSWAQWRVSELMSGEPFKVLLP